MAGYALFIGWGNVVRGREELSLQVFQETVEYWTRAHDDGQIEGFEPYFLEPHGGGLTGFMLIHGERERLDQLRESDEFERIVMRADAVVEELGVVTAYTGEVLGRQMTRFQELAGQLAAA
ncbi:MAG TPA: hypothetical protein VFG31_08475 [Conexibacter sp.]|nr:hypothetical protein [Conexibacter sp.]